MAQSYEIRLVITRIDDTYLAEWTAPDGQLTEKFPLGLPLSVDDTEELRWYLEENYKFQGAGDKVHASRIEKKLITWGRSLFDAIFGSAQGNQVYNNLMQKVRDGATGLLTLGTTDPDILVQPWEMMRNEGGPLSFQGVTIRRQLKGAHIPKELQFALPLRVLLIVSRPTDVGFIDPRNSIRPLLDALDKLSTHQVKIDFCDPPTLARLEEMITHARDSKQPYHIVHFDGHGTYLPKTGVGALCFERDDATNHLVTGRELGDQLVRLDVPLAIMEACRGADLSDRPVFGSVAPALLESGVGSVIAFSHSVHIEAARLLVERFYQQLVTGKSIGQALESARSHMQASPARFLHLGPKAKSVDIQDWFIPQLYQVGSDPLLMTDGTPTAATAEAPPAKADTSALHNFPPQPMYRFHGRALELLEMQRAFRKHPALLLTGGGGMGKTALAREAAHWWLRTGRFDTAVFCSFEQRAGAEQVVQLLGRALEGDQFSSRPADEQWSAAVNLFRTRRVLLVWDNFESTLPIYQRGEPTSAGLDAADEAAGTESVLSFGDDARREVQKLYRELNEDTPSSRLLVTCRPAETGLPGIKEMPLGGLKRYDSLHLLAAVLDIKGIKMERDGYERDEIDALLSALSDHPLSIELVAPHLKELTPETIRAEFGHLLEKFADASAFEERNKSLLASLEFSKKRLSEEAQKVLPYLAWFEGGVFEKFFLEFSELVPEVWASVQSELVATALISVEDPEPFTIPYLRFHPTLPFAASATEVPDPDSAEQRFIAVYLRVMKTVDAALRGKHPAAGMALLAHEDTNFRSAMRRAFGRGDRKAGWGMADSLQTFLQRTGRLRERDVLVSWVREQFPEGGKLDAAMCASVRDEAWSRFHQGHVDEAIQEVQDLIKRLETEGLAEGEDTTVQLVLANMYVGRMFYSSGRAGLALEPLENARTGSKQLGDAGRGNLSAVLGDLANTYIGLGRFDDALEANDNGLAISRESSNKADAAGILGRSAQILMMQQRYAEADARYREAVDAAKAAGDLDLQGTLHQHRGALQNRIGDYSRAIELHKKAIEFFQRAGDTEGEMQTCDLLGTAERRLGHIDLAEAWYLRSRELAKQLNDREHSGVVAQNMGILYQNRAEHATDSHTRAEFFREAVASVEESLAIKMELGNRVGEEASLFQLGVLHHRLQDFGRAEKYAQEALEIAEPLMMPDVYKNYQLLAEIARDRGNTEKAAEWEAKRDAKIAELERLRQGGAEGPPASQLDQLVKPLLALAQAAYAARQSGTPLPPQAAEALAQLAEAPSPLKEMAGFLSDFAGNGPVPEVPAGLPKPLEAILEALAETLK